VSLSQAFPSGNDQNKKHNKKDNQNQNGQGCDLEKREDAKIKHFVVLDEVWGMMMVMWVFR
jgi:hypothetical protein